MPRALWGLFVGIMGRNRRWTAKTPRGQKRPQIMPPASLAMRAGVLFRGRRRGKDEGRRPKAEGGGAVGAGRDGKRARTRGTIEEQSRASPGYRQCIGRATRPNPAGPVLCPGQARETAIRPRLLQVIQQCHVRAEQFGPALQGGLVGGLSGAELRQRFGQVGVRCLGDRLLHGQGLGRGDGIGG
jgi:hypothetical protein